MTGHRDPSAGWAAPIPAVPDLAASYEIRTLSTAAEYLDYFRLRHNVYSRLGYQERGIESGIELDEFDLYAIPVGAFDAASGALVGTIRLISTEREPGRGRLVAAVRQPGHERLVRHILAGYGDPDLAELARWPRGVLASGMTDGADATWFVAEHRTVDIEHVREGDHNLGKLQDPQKRFQALQGAYFTSGLYRYRCCGTCCRPAEATPLRRLAQPGSGPVATG